MTVVRLDTSAHMTDDYQGLDIKGTDPFDQWWEDEHTEEDDVDEVDYDVMDDDYE